MGYQYALYQHRKKLREERDMIFQDNNSISREEYWDDYSAQQRRRVLKEPYPTARRGER
jgi:hypothetical protein